MSEAALTMERYYLTLDNYSNFRDFRKNAPQLDKDVMVTGETVNIIIDSLLGAVEAKFEKDLSRICREDLGSNPRSEDNTNPRGSDN